MLSRVSKTALAAQSLVNLTQTPRQGRSINKMLPSCFLFKEMSMVQKLTYPALGYLPVSREGLVMTTVFLLSLGSP